MPVAPIARSLVMLEMFYGVMSIAIVVSRLIGMIDLRRQQNRWHLLEEVSRSA